MNEPETIKVLGCGGDYEDWPNPNYKKMKNIDQICNKPEGSFLNYTQAKKIAARMLNAKNEIVLTKKELNVLFKVVPEFEKILDNLRVN